VDGVLFNKSQTTLILCPEGKAGSYTVPNSVTSIGSEAFARCYNLTSITIPNSVTTSIGDYAFYGFYNLTSVTIGNGVTSIGNQAFGNCYSLTSVTIGNGVTSIGNQAFGLCYGLTSVTIPNSVTSIGDNAFLGCGLTSVTIPDSVTSIGGDAFYRCYSLTSVTIGNGVTSIGNYAFYQCTSLTNVTIGNSVTSIGNYAFFGCSLTNVTIPNSVISIGNSAFYACSSLTSVMIGNSVTSIGDNAFAYCTSLTGVYFKGNAPSIDGDVFYGADNATVYYLAGTTGWGSTFGGRPTALWSSSDTTPPTIATSCPLLSGTVGTAYSLTLVATSGTTPYTWSFSSGILPPGLSLTSGGVLSGTPTTANTYSFTIRCTGANSLYADKSCSLMVTYTPSVNYTLTVDSSGASSVSIASSTEHDGITPYNKTVLAGTSVNLQVPQYVGAGASRMSFTGWSGSVTRSDLSITFTMDDTKTITANYVSDPVTYTMNLYKTGDGMVKVNDAFCPLPWSGSFTPGTIVTLEAVADSEWQFSHWSGDLSGDTNPIATQMNDNNSVTAHFTSIKLPCKFGSFDGQKNVELTLKDCSNNDVTFILTGYGYGEIDCEDCNFSNITLYDTTEKTVFSITTKSNVGTSVGDIIVNSSLKAISAKNVNLRGDITVTGSLGTLTLNNVADSHTITIGSSLNPKAAVTIVFDQVSDLTINSQTPIKSLTATDWLGGSIDAPSIGSITTKGDKKRSITGDLDVDVTSGTIQSIKAAGTLSGNWTCNSVKNISAMDVIETNLTLNQQPDAKMLALGSLIAKGWIDSSRILSTGNIGTVTAGAMINSTCFAGVAEGVSGLPDAETASFSETATIKSVAIKGIKTEPSPYYINSNIAATNILSTSIAYPQSYNGGVPFGLSADNIKKLTIKKTDGTTTSLKNLGKSTDSKTIDGVEIHLY
jgi:hypothetical protein